MDTRDETFADFAAAETPRLLRLAMALTGDANEAWDLVQESLVRVGSRWGRLHAENPAGYARTVMIRLNIDRLRHLRREFPVFQIRDRAVIPEPGRGLDHWLSEGLAALTPRQRTAVALRFVEDLTLNDMADRMGCSLGTVKSHLSRGLEQLRRYSPKTELKELAIDV